MRALRVVSGAAALVVLAVAPARAQTPPAADRPLGSAGPATGAFDRLAFAAPPGPGAPAEPAAAAAKNGFVWDNRPSLRYGDSFRLDLSLTVSGDVRTSSVDLAPYGGAFEWATTRVGVKGSFLKIFEYQVEHDIQTDGQWRDVYLNVRLDEYAQVRGGKFKIPFGYERLTSPADLDFVKRTSATRAIAPGRATGVMAHGRVYKRAFHYAVAFFKGDGDESPSFEPPELLPGEQWEEPTSWSWAGRATFAPLRLGSVPGKYNNLEIGGAYMSSDVPQGKNNLHGKTLIGEPFFGRHYYVNGSRTRMGVEVSWPAGPASVSAEYLRARDARIGVGVGNQSQLDNDLPDIDAKGWYIAGTYLITGEKKEGGVKPRRPLFRGGFGAIELAARYEKLAFSSDGGASDPASKSARAATVNANAERAMAVGVNWYANRWAKIRADFVREELDDPSRGPAPDQPSFWTFVWQFQIAF